MRDDVYVYLSNDLPNSLHEMVSPNCDGTYTVLINSRLNYASQLEAYNHAMSHIDSNDFDADCTLSVQEIEAKAHGLKGNDFVKDIKRKIRRSSPKINFLIKHGHDFFSSAEREWLEPKEY